MQLADGISTSNTFVCLCVCLLDGV